LSREKRRGLEKFQGEKRGPPAGALEGKRKPPSERKEDAQNEQRKEAGRKSSTTDCSSVETNPGGGEMGEKEVVEGTP